MNTKKSHLDPFLKKHRNEVSSEDFPEVEGLGISYEEPCLCNGGSPNIMIQDEVGIVPPQEFPLTPKESYKGVIWDASKKPGEFQWNLQGIDPAVSDIQAGAEPVITTAGDFYEQLLQQPRVVQAEVLIKKDRIYTIRRVSPGKETEMYIAGSDLTDFQKEIVLDKILGEYRSQGDEVAVAIAKKPETKPMFDTGSLMDQMKISMDKQQLDAYKKFAEEQERALMFGSKVHEEMQGKADDLVTSLGTAMMQSREMGVQLQNPLSKPIIDIPNP